VQLFSFSPCAEDGEDAKVSNGDSGKSKDGEEAEDKLTQQLGDLSVKDAAGGDTPKPDATTSPAKPSSPEEQNSAESSTEKSQDKD
jgi:hypothetical protein